MLHGAAVLQQGFWLLVCRTALDVSACGVERTDDEGATHWVFSAPLGGCAFKSIIILLPHLRGVGGASPWGCVHPVSVPHWSCREFSSDSPMGRDFLCSFSIVSMRHVLFVQRIRPVRLVCLRVSLVEVAGLDKPLQPPTRPPNIPPAHLFPPLKLVESYMIEIQVSVLECQLFLRVILFLLLTLYFSGHTSYKHQVGWKLQVPVKRSNYRAEARFAEQD